MNATILKLVKDARAAMMLVIVATAIAIATPIFLTTGNLLNIVLASSVVALLAAGQTYVIILAEIDLSVGSILALSGVATALVLQAHSVFIGLIAGIGVGVLAGLINGLLVTKARMPAFIATLGTMSVFGGLTLYITQGNPISVDNGLFLDIGQANPLGVPFPAWIVLAALLCFGFLLSRTRFGRHIYAVGDNPEAARLSGINVHWIKISAFVISGMLASIAGFILTARLSTAEPTAGMGEELSAIAAVIIGGTSLMGGRGALLGSFIGAILLGVIDNGLNLLNVSPFLQGVAKGLVILLAVFIERNSDVMQLFWRKIQKDPVGRRFPEKPVPDEGNKQKEVRY
ncbi:MAG: ABC transporter permease [Rhodanobacter sp.]|nr:MAG: ABC transporter permease [Rhodanobacter sp.]TAM42894.1 MAG: ABC transporter permease [Rhodanobacter sp.]